MKRDTIIKDAERAIDSATRALIRVGVTRGEVKAMVDEAVDAFTEQTAAKVFGR